MTQAIGMAVLGVVMAMAGFVFPGIAVFVVAAVCVTMMAQQPSQPQQVEKVIIQEVQVPVVTQYTEASEGRLEFRDGSALQTRNIRRWN